jgi:predicted Holliday junction resolvase-like endonuclease
MKENANEKTSTNFAVLSIRKIKTIGGSVNVVAHNLRQKINKSLNEFVDSALSHFNKYEGVKNHEEFKKKNDEMVENAHLKRKIQTNASAK